MNLPAAGIQRCLAIAKTSRRKTHKPDIGMSGHSATEPQVGEHSDTETRGINDGACVYNRTADVDFASTQTSMNRFIKTAILLGAVAIPSLLAAAFLIGCCVLPFHEMVHRLAPICQSVARIASGDDHGGEGHPHESEAPQPRKESIQTWGWAIASEPHSIDAPADVTAVTNLAASSYRSFISAGAARCDDDVGLLLLLTTFRI